MIFYLAAGLRTLAKKERQSSDRELRAVQMMNKYKWKCVVGLSTLVMRLTLWIHTESPYALPSPSLSLSFNTYLGDLNSIFALTAAMLKREIYHSRKGVLGVIDVFCIVLILLTEIWVIIENVLSDYRLSKGPLFWCLVIGRDSDLSHAVSPFRLVYRHNDDCSIIQALCGGFTI